MTSQLDLEPIHRTVTAIDGPYPANVVARHELLRMAPKLLAEVDRLRAQVAAAYRFATAIAADPAQANTAAALHRALNADEPARYAVAGAR